jgi:hypothetical protein
MEYKHVNGQAYFRYAGTPPIINSPLANQYGIEVLSLMSLEEGRNVKLRIVMEDRRTRMTCHARIDYVRRDEAAYQYRVGFSHLSFSDQEFRFLLSNFVDESEKVLEIADRVRDKGVDIAPVIESEGLTGVSRIKAVSLPVSLIEEIDMKRGGDTFSDFVKKALTDYLNR